MEEATAETSTARGWRKLFEWIARRLSPHASAHGAGYLGVATAAVALPLLLMRALLVSPTGWGIDDFLSWIDLGPSGPVRAMLELWDHSERGAVAWVYLVVDSVLFVPLYSAFLLALAVLLTDGLGDDDPQALTRIERLLLTVLAAPVIALGLADLVENALGLARTGAFGVMLGALGTAAALYMLARVNRLRQVLHRLGPWCSAVAPVLALLCIAAGMSAAGCRRGDHTEALVRVWQLGCGAHRAKDALAIAAIAALVLAAAMWLFGVRQHASRASGSQHQRRHSRAQLRSALWDMIMRSRYVLLALAMVAGLTVGMDQGRDVVYAVAASPFRDGSFGPWDRVMLGLGSAAVFVVIGTAAWLLVFCCWLWTRSVCQIRSVHSDSLALAGVAPPDGPHGLPRHGPPEGTARPQDTFAKNWARALGAAPVVMLVFLCAGVIQDSVMAQGSDGARWMGPVFTVLAFAVLMVAVGLHFLRRRVRHGAEEMRYYDCLDWQAWSERAGFWRRSGMPGAGKYSVGGLISPFALPLLLWTGMLLCRLCDAFPANWLAWQEDYLPSMALAVVLFEIALWLCFFGWLSMLEVRRSIPWVGLVVLAVGALGMLGLTDNHVVWPAIEPDGASGTGALRMLGFTSLLALLLMAGYLWCMWLVRQLAGLPDSGAPGVSLGWRHAAAPFGLMALTALLMFAADHVATARTPARSGVAAAWSRPTLDIALSDWLDSLYAAQTLSPCGAAASAGGAGCLPVYLVSSEGGGIRAAVWTAFVLQRFAEQEPHFLARTFSMSGVSGGAVGFAAFRACSVNGEDRAACLRRFAQTDMLTPLLSAWMFEDALARLLPTSWCGTPACGFMSRGAWFEQTMEAGAPALRQGLIASHEAQRRAGHHLPYLLLNATWVESGERAVASDLQIDWRQFRGAKDQLHITGWDMPLGTAAHNAARFPFINAIGALEAPRPSCLARTSTSGGGPGEPVREVSAAAGEREVCGHLADGGYFDNSGGQSTLDVLQGLARCLEVRSDDADRHLYSRCLAMAPAQRQWLREHLVPQVLMIRNGVNPATAREEVCPAARDRPAPGAEEVAPRAVAGCSGLTDKFYAPERPVCRQRANVFIDFVGPALAALNVGGIGANGQLAEARQTQGVRALRTILGGQAAQSPLPPTAVIDLLPDGVRYPLGWHLSAVAVEGMWRQAQNCTR